MSQNVRNYQHSSALGELKGFPMAHYYFDIKNGMTQRDHAGLDLMNDAAAIARAYALAEQIGQNPPVNRECERQLCVIREDGHEVTRIPVLQEHG